MKLSRPISIYMLVLLVLLQSTPVAFANDACLIGSVRLALHNAFIERPLRNVVGKEELGSIFAELDEHPEILFCRVSEGCLVRAHAASWLLEEKGIQSRKIFAISSNSTNLRVSTDASETRFLTDWSYHVATTIELQGPHGTTTMVLDPSLFDKPVPIEVWKERVSKHSINAKPVFHQTSAYAYFPRDVEQPPANWRPVDLKWMIAGLKHGGELKEKYEPILKLYRLTSKLYETDPSFRVKIQDPDFNRWWYVELEPGDPRHLDWQQHIH